MLDDVESAFKQMEQIFLSNYSNYSFTFSYFFHYLPLDPSSIVISASSSGVGKKMQPGAIDTFIYQHPGVWWVEDVEDTSEVWWVSERVIYNLMFGHELFPVNDKTKQI